MESRDEKYQKFVKDDIDNNKGRLVNCCEELNYLLAHPQENAFFQKHYLNDILTYATLFSPYYKRFREFKGLSDFPIVNKQFLKDHADEIVVPEYRDIPDSKVKYTSGSTGTPFHG